MRKTGWTIALAAVLFTGLCVTDVWSADKKEDKTEKKAPSGKELFKTSCKVCHDKDSKHGEYTPMSLISKQWKRFFDKKYEKTHKDVDFPEKDKKVTDVITKEELKKIKKFAIDHAADSENPMTCG